MQDEEVGKDLEKGGAGNVASTYVALDVSDSTSASRWNTWRFLYLVMLSDKCLCSDSSC